MKNYITHLFFILTTFILIFPSYGQDARFEEGDKAPNFTVLDAKGNKVKLKKMLKEDKVLLVMLRHAWCPVCNVRVHELIKNHDAIKAKGYEVVVFFQSQPARLKSYVDDHELPFTAIPDPDMTIYKLYKMEYSPEKVAEDFASNKNTQALAQEGMGLIGDGYTTYKDENENGLDLVPGDFIINQKGKIERAYYGTYVGDHLPLDELK